MSTRIWLTVEHGYNDDPSYDFAQPTRCVVGRADDCDIRLPSDYGHADVSRHHCEFAIDPPSVRVRDLGSLNGTFVNGVKIGQRSKTERYDEEEPKPAGECLLKDGDRVQVGQSTLRVAIAEASDKPKPIFFPTGLLWY